MMWRPVAVMRGPMRDKGRLLDVVALRRARRSRPRCAGTLHIVTPEGADPWLFRGGFLLTRRRHAGRDRRRHPPRRARRAAARQPGPAVDRHPLATACTCSTGRSTRSSAGRPASPLSVAEFVVAMAITVVVTELSLPPHRDADPQGSRRALVAPPAGGARSRRRGGSSPAPAPASSPLSVFAARRPGDRRAQAERDRRSRCERGSGGGHRPRRPACRRPPSTDARDDRRARRRGRPACRSTGADGRRAHRRRARCRCRRPSRRPPSPPTTTAAAAAAADPAPSATR